MIDIVTAISNMVEQWDLDQRCGFCWDFTAPMRESDLNEYQFRDGKECCVLVAITDYSFEEVKSINSTTGLITNKSIVHNYQVHFLANDNLGINVYDEIEGHPISESKWDTILKPILECVGERAFDWCEETGQRVAVERWRGSQKIDWLDNNYTGWTFSAQVRELNVI